MSIPNEKLAAIEFDKWAEAGRGDSMAEGHKPAMIEATAGWVIDSSSLVVDVGCGNGWTLRQLIEEGQGLGCGFDISKAMIEQGRKRGGLGISLEVAPADNLPMADGVATHILNVESIYYYPSPIEALKEWARIAKAGCQLSMVLDLYEENPGSHSWIDALEINVHLLSAPECVELAQQAGWKEVTWRQVPNQKSPKSREEFTPSKFWPSYEMYLSTYAAGSLIVEGVR